MIKLFKPYISNTVLDSVGQTLRTGTITQGPMELEFEKNIKKYLGETALLLNSGTSALELAYHLVGIKNGDKVISTPMTCFATNAPLIRREANILWSDVDKNGLVDIESIASLLKTHDDIKAIVIVDWAGAPVEIGKIRNLIGDRKIPIIEDAAHRWDNFNSNPRDTGDYVCYSLQAIKFVTAVDGGVLITPKDQYLRARKLRWFGLDRDNNESFRAFQDIEEAGFKYHMNDVSATIGNQNLIYVYDRINSHRFNARRILEGIDGHIWNIKSHYWMLPILVEDREDFIEYMNKNNIEAGVVHSRNDKMSACKNFTTELPGLDYFSNHQVNIPCGWWLSMQQVEKIKEALNNYMREL